MNTMNTNKSETYSRLFVVGNTSPTGQPRMDAKWTRMTRETYSCVFASIRGFGSTNSREKGLFRILFAVPQTSDPIRAAPGTS